MNRRDHRLGWILCAPAVTVMLVVTIYPVGHALWLSLHRYDLRFPDRMELAGLGNYAAILGSPVWWRALGITLLVTVISVALELVLGFALAWTMHRALVGRRLVRTSALVPYGLISVVAAMAWKFGFDPVTGFINPWLGTEIAWLSARGTALFVIILTEVWKTTPFMALLLLAGLTLIPEDLLRAARVDGAGPAQRLFRITLPLMKPAILVALLFRTLDAFRIFDSIFVLTRGAQDTASVSLVGYNTLIVRLNLGMGSAVSVLVLACIAAIAFLFVKGFGTPLGAGRDGS